MKVRYVKIISGNKAEVDRKSYYDRKNLDSSLVKLMAETIEEFYKKNYKDKKSQQRLKEGMIREVGHEKLFKILGETDNRAVLELFVDEDHRYELREEIAGNPNTPADILDKLARDFVDWVKVTTVRNPSTSTATLKHVARYSRSQDAKSIAKRELRRRGEL